MAAALFMVELVVTATATLPTIISTLRTSHPPYRHTFVVLHEVPWGSSSDSGSSSGGGNDSMIQHKHSHPWGMPYELFSILRIRFRTVVTDA